MMKIIISFILASAVLFTPVFAAEDIKDELLNESIKAVNSSGFDFYATVKNVENGEAFNLYNALNKICKLIFCEFKNDLGELVRLVVIAVMSGILCNLKLGDENTGVPAVSFFASYGIVAAIVANSFYALVQTALETISSLRLFMQSLLPVVLSAVSAGGGTLGGASFAPSLFAAVQIISFIAEKLLFPLIFTVTSLCIVNNLSASFHITKLIELIRQIIAWSLGVLLTVFVGILGLQGISAAFLDGIAGKTVRYALCSFIPLVGGVLADSIDAVIYSASVVKNTVGIAGIITLVLICLPPVVKITVFSIMYRLAAGVAEPAADKRIIALFSDAAGSITQISAILLVICIMFIISIAILLLFATIPLAVK